MEQLITPEVGELPVKSSRDRLSDLSARCGSSWLLKWALAILLVRTDEWSKSILPSLPSSRVTVQSQLQCLYSSSLL